MEQQHWTFHAQRLQELLTVSRLGIITDFDGTLSPFSQAPKDAQITPENALALDRLAEQVEIVALVSGRTAHDLYHRFERPWALYYGNHGMEAWRNRHAEVAEAARAWYTPLQEVLKTLGEPTIPGVMVENKRVTASIHYRLAPNPDEARQLLYALLAPLCEQAGLLLNEGQFVWEIKPPITLNKGTAVAEIIAKYALDGAMMLGDDFTDMTAMTRLRQLSQESNGRLSALSVGVVHPTTAPELYDHCDLTAHGIEDVARLLTWIGETIPVLKLQGEIRG